jgi:hypothetical protein
MAGDWIKLQCTTPDKPEIVKMAELLNIDQDAVLGKCARLWIWADSQSVDGNALSVTDSFLDRLTYCPGFAKALRQVGWLSGREGLLMIPNFGRHNGQTAKNRALTNDRVKKNRTECNAATVTKSLPEKRREETISFNCLDPQSGIVVPKKMQTPEVQQAVSHWLTHLESKDPLKVPQADSPQMQALWHKWSALGPERLVAAIWHSSSEGFVTLHEPPAARAVGAFNAKGKERTSLDSIDWGADEHN